MCMGCMTNADFVLTSGILGAASVRVGARRFLPRAPRWARKVSDAEAAEFVASLAPATQGPAPAAHPGPGPARDQCDVSDTSDTSDPKVLAGR